MNYSKGELEYIKLNILKGIRPDLRNLHKLRNLEIKPFSNTQADNAVEIYLNQSHIILSVQFIEENVLQPINSNFILPDILKRCLMFTLQQYKLSMNINLEIINDDGNIIFMCVKGLEIMLKNIKIPDTANLEQDIVVTFDMPTAYNFAIFHDSKTEIFLADPNKIEEESCDAILCFFCKKNAYSLITYKSNYISKFVLEKILLHLNTII